MFARYVYPAPVAVAISLLASAPVWAQDVKPEDIYAKSLPSTMTLLVNKGGDTVGVGTAFMSAKSGVAVTAWHVVKGAKKVVAKFSNGEEFDVSGVVDKDEKRDVALIRVKVSDRPGLPTTSSDPAIGTKAYVIGAPKGLEFSFSDGLVSQIQTVDSFKQFQFTCAASPGNSGGPLINGNGEVIGVVSWQLTNGQNLNFAVPISYALGLDNTLATQPWSEIKNTEDSPSSPVAVASQTTFDKDLAAAMLMEINGALMVEHLIDSVDDKGFDAGVPSAAYTVRADVARKIEQLLRSSPSGGSRAKWRDYVVESLAITQKRLNTMIAALRNGEEYRRWLPEDIEAVKEAGALIKAERVVVIEQEDKDVLKSSEPFMAVLPIDFQVLLGFIPDDIGFPLGAKFYPSDPTKLASVSKGSIAEKIGLKSGDSLVGPADRLFGSLQEFKKFIKENLGRKVKIRIERGGKLRDVELKIPNAL